MLKKVLSATIALALVSTTGSVAYSDVVIDNEKAIYLSPTTEIQVNIKKQLEVYKPESGMISDKVVLLSGIAAEGSKIIVEIYSTANISLENLSLNNYSICDFSSGGLSILNNEDNEINQDIYLPPVIKEIEVGAFGYFAEELELKIGLNKINIYIEGSEDSQVKFIYVNDYSKAEELIKRIDNLNFFNTMKQIFGQEETKELLKLNTMPKTQLEDKGEDNTGNEELTNDYMEEIDDKDINQDIPIIDDTN